MKKIPWLMLFFLIILHPDVYSQVDKFKALYMYNFTRYLEWPEEKQKGDFIIGVYGSSPIISELNIIAQKRNVGVQPIVVKKITSVSELDECNIVFVPDYRSSKVSELKRWTGKGIVFITDRPGLAKSFSGINYVTVNGKQNFEINRGNLEYQGIKVNSVLMSLGIPVK